MPSLRRPAGLQQGTDGILAALDQRSAAVWGPVDHGYLGWTLDPMLAASTAGLTSGTIYLQAFKLAKAAQISNIVVPITTFVTSPTNCYVGIYDALSKAQLAVSADQSGSWGTASTKTVALAAATPVLPAARLLYFALLYNGSGLAVRTAAAAATGNTNTISNAWLRGATAGTGQTALPAALGALTSFTTPLLLLAT